MQYDKGLYPLLLLKILEEYSDKDKPISMLEIQSLMESVSGHRPVRNTVTANFERLETIGFNIVKVKTATNPQRIFGADGIFLSADG